MWKTTGKNSSEAYAIACQNSVVYSVFPSRISSHIKITQFNLASVYVALDANSTKLTLPRLPLSHYYLQEDEKNDSQILTENKWRAESADVFRSLARLAIFMSQKKCRRKLQERKKKGADIHVKGHNVIWTKWRSDIFNRDIYYVGLHTYSKTLYNEDKQMKNVTIGRNNWQATRRTVMISYEW